MPEALLVNDAKPMPKSLSDSEMMSHHIEKSPSARGLFVEEMGASGAAPGDRAWLILAHRPEHDILVEFALGEETVEAEEIVEREKLVTFTVPTLPWHSKSIKLALTCGSSQISIPFNYTLRSRSVTPAVSMENLIEFATNGDTLALVQPFSNLISQADADGNTVLHLAARNSQSFALKTLLSAVPQAEKEEVLNVRNSRGQTALHCAIRSGDPDSVHYLMNHGASTNVADNHNNTAVHYLADAYNEAIFKEILEPNSGEPTNLDLLNDEGLAALHLAVRRLKLSLIEMLLEAGSAADGPDRANRTPLMHAVNMNDSEIVQYFIQRGANASHEDNDGETSLSLARQNANYAILGLLLDAGADATKKNKNGEALVDCEDEMIQKIIKGERVALPPKEPVSSAPKDLMANRPPLFGRSNPDATNGLDGHSRVVIRRHSEGELTPEPEEGVPSSGSRLEQLTHEVEEFLLDVDQPSTSRAQFSRGGNLPAPVGNFNKDDISCLDYLTRLRLSKLLDVEMKWERLATQLNCEHMIELISICSDADSSPTMILLDQFEQLPEARITRVREALAELEFTEAVTLIDDRFVY